MQVYTIVQLLTMAALTGLLFASGLRLSVAEVTATLGDRGRLVRTFLANFLGVPALAIIAVKLGGISPDIATGMLLLAAAPFAPVVPVFTRMFSGDLALATGFTSILPVLSSFLTPWVSAACLKFVSGSAVIQFNVLTILLVLLATITLPLLAGVGTNHRWPELSRRLLPPIEVVSEAIGAISLVFVSAVEWKSVLMTGWVSLLTMAILFELSVVLGFCVGGPSSSSRRVIALGTSNRNIALAVLIAVRSFPGSPAVAAVVANGLLMIGLGLLHTAWWRWRPAGKI